VLPHENVHDTFRRNLSADSIPNRDGDVIDTRFDAAMLAWRGELATTPAVNVSRHYSRPITPVVERAKLVRIADMRLFEVSNVSMGGQEQMGLNFQRLRFEFADRWRKRRGRGWWRGIGRGRRGSVEPVTVTVVVTTLLLGLCERGRTIITVTVNRLLEAEPLCRRAPDIYEHRFGPDHPNVATCLKTLATLLQDTNRLAEAEPLFRRAVLIQI
jgi:hypothetical protein